MTGRKVVFDASIDEREVEPVVYLQQQYIHREKKQVVVDINEQTDWVEYVDSYEYSDPKELGTVQKQILKRCGQDMLLFAIKRKHIGCRDNQARVWNSNKGLQFFCKSFFMT